MIIHTTVKQNVSHLSRMLGQAGGGVAYLDIGDSLEVSDQVRRQALVCLETLNQHIRRTQLVRA